MLFGAVFVSTYLFYRRYDVRYNGQKLPPAPALSWRRSTVVERWSLTGELSLSCARLLAGRMITLWARRPLSVSQHGQLSHPSLRGR